VVKVSSVIEWARAKRGWQKGGEEEGEAPATETPQPEIMAGPVWGRGEAAEQVKKKRRPAPKGKGKRKAPKRLSEVERLLASAWKDSSESLVVIEDDSPPRAVAKRAKKGSGELNKSKSKANVKVKGGTRKGGVHSRGVQYEPGAVVLAINHYPELLRQRMRWLKQGGGRRRPEGARKKGGILVPLRLACRKEAERARHWEVMRRVVLGRNLRKVEGETWRVSRML